MRLRRDFLYFSSSMRYGIPSPIFFRAGLYCILYFLMSSIFCPTCNADWSMSIIEKPEILNSDMDNGIAVSFVDYDGDRYTDIIYFNPNELSLYVAFMLKDFRSKKMLLVSGVSSKLRGVIAGDFNGDSKVDLLLLEGTDNNSVKYSMRIFFHPSTNKGAMNYSVKLDSIRHQPLVLDYNADGIMDIMSESADGISTVWIGQTDKNFKMEELPSIAKWGSPAYSGFLDALSEYRPGIFLHTVDGFQFYRNQEGKFTSPLNIPWPTGNGSGKPAVMGAPLFEDWYGLGQASFLLPYCLDADCKDSHVAIYNFANNTWKEVTVPWGDYQLCLSANVGLSSVLELPSLLPARSGDVNLDRYPDVVTVLQVKSQPTVRSAVVLLFDGNGGITLSPLSKISSNVSDVALFDINEDSSFDLLTMMDNGAGGIRMQVHMQNAPDSSDNYFLKVMVLTGRCATAVSCALPEQKLPYGMPVPGATLRYLTEGVHGDRLFGKAMLSSTASFQALQLPFHLFGLGNFANYIEDLTVAMPTSTATTRQHDFTFIVPKTQVVIIPFPLEQPSKWKYLLYIDPFHDKKVIYVAAALLSVGLLVVVIISIFQYLEYREDKLEKLKEVQKFSFDAM